MATYLWHEELLKGSRCYIVTDVSGTQLLGKRALSIPNGEDAVACIGLLFIARPRRREGDGTEEVTAMHLQRSVRGCVTVRCAIERRTPLSGPPAIGPRGMWSNLAIRGKEDRIERQEALP